MTAETCTAIVPYYQGAEAERLRILGEVIHFGFIPPYRITPASGGMRVRCVLRPKRKRKPRPRTVRPGRVIRTHKELAYALRTRSSVYWDWHRMPCAWMRSMQYWCVTSYMENGRLRYMERIPGVKPRKRRK